MQSVIQAEDQRETDADGTNEEMNSTEDIVCKLFQENMKSQKQLGTTLKS